MDTAVGIAATTIRRFLTVPKIYINMEAQEIVLIKWDKLRSGLNLFYSGVEAAHYCTGNPEQGWCLYLRIDSTWNQVSERQFAPKPGMEPKLKLQPEQGWYWVWPDHDSSAKINFDEATDFTTSLKINPICPDCDYGTMQYDLKQKAFTENKNLVVVPLVCGGCGFGTSIHLEIKL